MRDVKEYLLECVGQDSEDEMWRTRQAKMMGQLINMVTEIKAEMKEMKAKIKGSPLGIDRRNHMMT